MMKRFRRILISLNLTDQDPTVIQYANLVARLSNPARLELVNVLDLTQLPESMVTGSPALVDTAEESNKAAIDHLVTSQLQMPASCLVKGTVLRGNPAQELVRYADAMAADLIIVGRDPTKDRAGTVPERLARIASCSVLVVPRGANPQMDSILVAVDFSRHSKAAIAHAVAFGRAAELDEVRCLHVYDVPSNYARFGKSYEDFDTITKRNALTASQRFNAQIDTRGLRLRSIVRQAKLPSIAIQDEALTAGFDLIVMGAQGSSDAQNVLLGSATQRSVNATQTPLLVAKAKRHSAGFLKTLLKVFRRDDG